MSTTLSLFAPEPGGPGSPVASRTGVFVAALLDHLEAADPPLELAPEWLQPPGTRASSQMGLIFKILALLLALS